MTSSTSSKSPSSSSSSTTLRTPTAEEVAAYRADGYLVVRDLVPHEVLDAAEEGMRRFYAGDVDRPFPGRTRYDNYDWVPEHGAGLRKNDYTSLMVEELSGLVRWPGIAAFAAGLAGARGIRLWHDQLLFKPPTSASADAPVEANVGWHTDRQYWTSCSSEQMLTCWVPFHDCNAAMGGVTFLPGSHRRSDVSGLDFFDQDLSRLDTALAGAAASAPKVVPELRRGDVTFHHCGTVHGSGANGTQAPRRSMAIHLQPIDNAWTAGVQADGSPAYHRNDELVRAVDGHPDYADPRICPVLWPV